MQNTAQVAQIERRRVTADRERSAHRDSLPSMPGRETAPDDGG
jgi:hypothetical protein